MVGKTLDRYSVEAELGAGGMATVYRVRHLTLGSMHALKVLKVQSASIRQRLVQEGRVQASLRHTNIVAVTDVIDVDGTPGLVMEFIDGPSLEEWLQEHRPSLPEAESLFRGILAGVGRAHRQGLVHRDLKPGNVLLDSSGDEGVVPKVADFGLAKILDDEESIGSQTRSGIAMGTPAYMAPEQVRSAKNVDQRADIFALGCILYELVSGTRPFHGNDLLEIMTAVCSGVYAPLDPNIPERVRDTVAACLIVDREKRVADCAGVRRLLSGERSAALPSAATGEQPAVAATGGLQSAVPALVERHDTFAFPGGSPLAKPPPYAGESAMSLVVPALQEPAQGTDLSMPPPEPTPRRWPMLVALGAGLSVLAGTGILAVGTMWLMARTPETASAPEAVSETQPDEVPRVSLPETTPVPAEGAPVIEVAPLAPDPVGPVATRGTGTGNKVGRTTPAVPPPTPSKGTLRVVGDNVKVRLVNDAGSFPAGAVPPGEYTIRAQFSGQPVVAVGNVTIRSGQETTVTCNAEFQMCRSR